MKSENKRAISSVKFPVILHQGRPWLLRRQCSWERIGKDRELKGNEKLHKKVTLGLGDLSSLLVLYLYLNCCCFCLLIFHNKFSVNRHKHSISIQWELVDLRLEHSYSAILQSVFNLSHHEYNI